jgi:hypothetical protein
VGEIGNRRTIKSIRTKVGISKKREMKKEGKKGVKKRRKKKKERERKKRVYIKKGE